MNCERWGGRYELREVGRGVFQLWKVRGRELLIEGEW